MRKKLSGLYAITHESLMPERHFLSMAEAALAAGTAILQYRDKSHNTEKRLQQAQALSTLCKQYNALLIINDDVNLAMQVDADGVHIGKNDHSFKDTRALIGANKIIGVTCYNQLPLAEKAIEEGADYIAFGSFFGSNIKPGAPVATANLISSIKRKHNTPVCCIGGITTENYLPLINEGADMLAVISDIFQQTSPREIKEKCAQFSFTKNRG